jgi:hypothetical protein
MIVVDGVDNVFLAVLDDLPDGTSDHVTSGNWGNAQTFALAFEQHSLNNVKKINTMRHSGEHFFLANKFTFLN